MNPVEINETIAKSLGWQRYGGAGFVNYEWAPGHIVPVVPKWCKEQGTGLDFIGPARMEHANYVGSRDACLEFEERLSPLHQEEYIHILQDVALIYLIGYVEENYRECLRKGFELATASPLHRCEAYLKLRGLWRA